MYTVTVSRDFVAQHWLTVPDPGPEGELHSHHFEVDVRLEGEHLDEYGYLVDIDDVEAALDRLEGRYRDATLNELPEFDGFNPSVEHFSRLFAKRFLAHLDTGGVDRIEVTMWEDESAAASFAEHV
jgi:6-pyruvoyltetrahydropterin/6-carboxytetrahydropterin synthase